MEEKRESVSRWPQVYVYGAVWSPKGGTGRKVLYNYMPCHPIQMHPIYFPLVGLQAPLAALGHLLESPRWQGSSGAVTAADAGSNGAKGLPHTPAPRWASPARIHGRWMMLYGYKTALSRELLQQLIAQRFHRGWCARSQQRQRWRRWGLCFSKQDLSEPKGWLLAPWHPPPAGSCPTCSTTSPVFPSSHPAALSLLWPKFACASLCPCLCCIPAALAPLAKPSCLRRTFSLKKKYAPEKANSLQRFIPPSLAGPNLKHPVLNEHVAACCWANLEPLPRLQMPPSAEPSPAIRPSPTGRGAAPCPA